MRYELRLPHVGESVTEAVLGPWLKGPGDIVKKFDPKIKKTCGKKILGPKYPLNPSMNIIKLKKILLKI